MIAAITPSRITSNGRALMARTAASGLYSAASWQHIVVDSSDAAFRGHVADIYAQSNVIYSRMNMRDATLAALRKAMADGSSTVFIHLDDMHYGPMAKQLMVAAGDAMDRGFASVIHLSNYPILDPACARLGNATHVVAGDDVVSFRDGVELSPLRTEAYTLWRAPFGPAWNAGPFWPLAMWFALYDAKFLESLLEGAAGMETLGAVEVFYRNKDNWGKAIASHPTCEVGFVNMQHGGIEMHHNSSNFIELANSPNAAIR